MKRGQKRTKLQRAADLFEVEAMALKGVPRSKIITTLAAKRGYKISRSQLGYDLAKLKSEWKARASSAFAVVVDGFGLFRRDPGPPIHSV